MVAGPSRSEAVDGAGSDDADVFVAPLRSAPIARPATSPANIPAVAAVAAIRAPRAGCLRRVGAFGGVDRRTGGTGGGCGDQPASGAAGGNAGGPGGGVDGCVGGTQFGGPVGCGG